MIRHHFAPLYSAMMTIGQVRLPPDYVPEDGLSLDTLLAAQSQPISDEKA